MYLHQANAFSQKQQSSKTRLVKDWLRGKKKKSSKENKYPEFDCIKIEF